MTQLDALIRQFEGAGYEPEPEPEEKRSGLWLAIGGPILFGLVCGVGLVIWSAVH